MFIQDDYTYKETELDEYLENAAVNNATEHSEVTQLYLKISELNHSQYIKVQNKTLINILKNDVYKLIKHLACICGGKSEMEITDNNEICYITLYVKHLFLSKDFPISTSTAIDILKTATWTKASIEGDYVKYQFMFQLYEEIKVKDNSKEIENLKRELKQICNSL